MSSRPLDSRALRGARSEIHGRHAHMSEWIFHDPAVLALLDINVIAKAALGIPVRRYVEADSSHVVGRTGIELRRIEGSHGGGCSGGWCELLGGRMRIGSHPSSKLASS
jgi:hypothetical protein